MQLKLSNNLNLEIDIPILEVDHFQFLWKPDHHALLAVKGYMNKNNPWEVDKCSLNHIKIWLDEGGKIQALFYGYITKIEIKTIGQTEQILLEAISASYQLDRQVFSRSFQDMSKTYGEVVQEAAEEAQGLVIRNRDCDKKIDFPIIQYEETAWEFAKRMASSVGTIIIPDIDTGTVGLWFGMKQGNAVPMYSEDQYSIKLSLYGPKAGLRILFKSQNFYKIGDFMTYLGRNLRIIQVKACFKKGELIFSYVLEEAAEDRKPMRNIQLAGLGLWGDVLEIKEDSVKIGLEIDEGKNRGDYFYPWHPETGNSLYAMPEIGAKVLLRFYKNDEGAGVHCLNKLPNIDKHYEDRTLAIEGGNSASLTKESVSLLNCRGNSISLTNNIVIFDSTKKVKISAKGKIRLIAKRIEIQTPDDLDICQG